MGVIYIKEIFEDKINKYKQELDKQKNTYDKIGYLRLLIFMGLIYFLYNKMILGISVCVVIFIMVLVYHSMIKENMRLAQDMIDINHRYIMRISGEWIEFEETGEEFINKDHAYSFDLDIVGDKSLFQLINITNTFPGKSALRDLLMKPVLKKEEITKNQEATRELGDKLDFCQQLEHIGIRNKGKFKNPQKLLAYSRKNSRFIKSDILRKVIYYMPVITIPLSLIIIVFKLGNLKALMYGLLFIQLIAWAANAMKLAAALSDIQCSKNMLGDYSKIIDLVSKEEFTSDRLNTIKRNLVEGEKSARKGIKKLMSIADRIDIRNNGLLYIMLNILFLWDYQCIFSIEQWRSEYGLMVEDWLNDIGSIEAFASIAVLNHISAGVYPEISDNSLEVTATNLGHPLIPQDERVCNDVNMNNNIMIITGSNMSGKTTFLRTIGINLVLAYAGGMVTAGRMKASVMDICTSMRISDNLHEGVSTFYGELVRIKTIIDKADESNKMIFLIDEIFRGTNSKDRIMGAVTVLKHLNEAGVIGAITTHDMELCVLDESKGINNYHFEEYYKDNKIYFDYKLRSGQSTTTNAKFLMEMVGIEM